MRRDLSDRLGAWLANPDRRPLVLRGARQVGKTWLVRELARQASLDLIELNFEREPGLKKHFATNDPERILGELSLALGREIDPAHSLLFLDEIQFMFDKHLPLAVRCDANPPSDMDVSVSTTRGDPVAYRLVGVPFHLLWNLGKILEG